MMTACICGGLLEGAVIVAGIGGVVTLLAKKKGKKKGKKKEKKQK